MFFKNIFAFRILDDNIDENKLSEALKNNKIKPCDKTELETFGWDYVVDTSYHLFEKVSNAYFLRYKLEKKVLPPNVIKEYFQQKVKNFVKENGKKPNKEEKENIKENVILELAPRAFIDPSYINGYLDFKNKYLVIDASSPKKADEFLTLLRQTIELDVELVEPKYDTSTKMTEWLKDGGAETPFELEMGCVLKDIVGVGSKIIANKHELDAEEIKNHIESGKVVEKLDLNWHQRIDFTLTSEFKITKVKFRNIVSEQIKEDLGESDDEYSSFSASMYIMVEDFAELINDLLSL